ncbi:MAG TPA: hypothetical protein VLD84_03220 [Nitrososphaeraceae archaeon]|nr:hypothetical protein [Nitrososphaeraceae archaeon]
MINEENEFNKIHDSLTEIEFLVDRMYVPTRTMEDAIHKREIVADRGNYIKFVDFNINFTTNYYDCITAIVDKLVDITNNKIHSEKDSQILYRKIIDILRKIIYQKGHRGFIGELDEAVKKFKHSKSSPFLNILDIDINLIDDTVSLIENFKKQFLN